MVRKLRRITGVCLLGLVLLLLLPVSVMAFIDDPTSISINSVYVYENCREEGDQLYIIDYTITYPVDGNPDENITEAFICRLMDGATELRGVAPYSYYNEGYDRGVVAIYFDAATAPVWEGAYTMELAGNPTLTWEGGDFSSASVSTFNLWQSNSVAITQTVLSSRILYLADILELAWSVDMIESLAGGHSLTTYGEDYFTNVLPYAAVIAPYAFSGQLIEPEVEAVDTSTDYADDLETDISGTVFDFTSLADAFGVDRGPLTALLYYGGVAVFLGLLVSKLKTTKPVMLLSLPLVVGGAFVGVPLIITIIVGVVSCGFIAWVIFYRPSTA